MIRNTLRAALLLLSAVTLICVAGARAGEAGGMGALFRPWPQGQIFSGHFRVMPYSDEDVKDQGDREFRMTEVAFGGTVPLYVDDVDEFLFSVDYSLLDIDTEAVFPRMPAESFPDPLRSVGLGLIYKRQLGGDRSLAVSARAGSASDDLFENDTEVYSASVMMRLPDGSDTNAWLLGVGYSNRRGSDSLDHVPLPMVAYQMTDGGRNWMILGVPFSAVHLETDYDIKIDASYGLLRNLSVRAAYPLIEGLDLYGLFRWKPRSYFRADREDEDDRIVFYDKRLGGGLSYRLNRMISLDAQVGWSFDRFVYEEEDYDDRKDNWIEFEDAVYGVFTATLKF